VKSGASTRGGEGEMMRGITRLDADGASGVGESEGGRRGGLGGLGMLLFDPELGHSADVIGGEVSVREANIFR
jgi:hypothetical protein